MTALIIIGLAALVAVLLSKRKRKAPTKTGWHIGPVIGGMSYSPGMPARPTPQGAGWYFDFPTEPTSHVHYVQWFSPPPLSGSIRVRLAVTGGGFVPQEYPDRPALVSLIIQRRGDNWQADTNTVSYRWFSRQSQVLEPGEYELTVPLDVSEWGDVYNVQDAARFAETLREVESIGLVFGSDGGRGHGVYATGPSRFTLLEIG